MGQLEDDILIPLIENNAFKAIEKTMEKDTALACLSLLGMYTESLGTFYSMKSWEDGKYIHYEKEKSSRKSFKRCLKYMGTEYIKVNNLMKTNKKYLYDVFRNGGVHEFEPKINYQYKINIPITSALGIEYLMPHLLRINLAEYFRDLKNGYYKWKEEISHDYDKGFAVMHMSGYSFPPQGGRGVIECFDEGNFIIKNENF